MQNTQNLTEKTRNPNQLYRTAAKTILSVAAAALTLVYSVGCKKNYDGKTKEAEIRLEVEEKAKSTLQSYEQSLESLISSYDSAVDCMLELDKRYSFILESLNKDPDYSPVFKEIIVSNQRMVHANLCAIASNEVAYFKSRYQSIEYLKENDRIHEAGRELQKLKKELDEFRKSSLSSQAYLIQANPE